MIDATDPLRPPMSQINCQNSAVWTSLAKVFPVTEKVRKRFESTFTNVLNHTNFAPPATQTDVPATFGILSAPQTAENAGNRTGQLALRVEF